VHHAFKLEDREINIELARAASGYRLHVDGQVVPVALHPQHDGSALLTVAGRSERVIIAVRGDDVFVHLGGNAYQLRYEHPLDRLAAQGHGAAEDGVRAPMPGSLVAVHVEAGAVVAKGQTLLVMESMKMETSIAAPRDGVIEAVHFEQGQTFDRDALLVSLAAGEQP
jgi:3-methylcrotonyl-CoA carboxylase alpha subunit